jgi:glyoxylase-like metal-dependent hydrolase (beta-lactamase superfamily II)
LLTRRQALSAAAAVTGNTLVAAALRSQSAPGAITASSLGAVTLLQGAGCNVVAMAGEHGALMIDGGLSPNAAVLIDTVLGITGNARIHTLINTHWHPEQTGANERVGRDGAVIFAHEITRMYLANAVYSVTFEGRRAPLPAFARPNETTRGEGSLEFADTRIDYGYLPAAHTDGDLYLHFPELDLLVAGGVVAGDRWPLLDYRNGAWFGGRVRALEWLAEVVNPETVVVPAHGPTISGRDIVRHKEIYLALFETLIDYMNLGLGAEDVVKRNPLGQYMAEFGDAAAFLDGAYRSMLIAYVPD